MKLWLLSQKENDGYDTYSDVVVAAETAEDARRIAPGNYYDTEEEYWEYWKEAATDRYSSWASKPENVSVSLLGEAAKGIKRGIILASFHAG